MTAAVVPASPFSKRTEFSESSSSLMFSSALSKEIVYSEKAISGKATVRER